VLDGTVDVACTASFAGAVVNYPHLAGLQPDLYRCFMEQTWAHVSPRGSIALIHPESHFTDEKAGALREATYRRLRRHWQFVNELSLFEIHNLVTYGVHVYAREREPDFIMATSLYHPDTVIASLRHDGSGTEPGLKTEEGAWDQRPHRNRVTRVDLSRLRSWHALLEDEATLVGRTRMVYAVNRATADVLAKLAAAPRLGELGLQFSRGWDESIDRKKGVFDIEWGPVGSWDHAILQGPHLFVANPFYKSPNPTMSSNKDWSPIDLETLAPDAKPVTAYKPAMPLADYDAAYTHWGQERISARSHYRIAWRRMAANTGERTLIPALIPPGAAHVDGVSAIALPLSDRTVLLTTAGTMSSLLVDSSLRGTPKGDIREPAVRRLPDAGGRFLQQQLALRVARLSCLTAAYATLWNESFELAWGKDAWAGDSRFHIRPPLGVSEAEWNPNVPLRRSADRRQAQVEIDAIVALSLGVTADELCTVYRTQFPVLYGYDRNSYLYDASGRLVPNTVLKVWRQKGDLITAEERTAINASGNTYEYELPFVTLDREADMRQAYAHFERILQDSS
jgi:hypothetical protein